VAGDEGCGKSLALRAFQWLIQQKVEEVCLTPETESAALVGQLSPSDRQGGKSNVIEWEDGSVTRAVTQGSCLLLDNLNEAESAVLERLNPLLEDDCTWVLTEKGDTRRLEVVQGFKVVATMTYATRSHRELSPALYNRFTVISWPEDSTLEALDLDTLEHIVQILLGEPVASRRVADSLLKMFKALNSERNRAVTLRSLFQMLDCVYKLGKLPGRDVGSRLWCAYLNCIDKRISQQQQYTADPSQPRTSFKERVRTIISQEFPGVSDIDFELHRHIAPDYVLTEKRMGYAMAIRMAVLCSMPVLLEGPAAVGKTSLVKVIAPAPPLVLFTNV
jgi:midasin (ATPase involved in ribosome maturation)